MAEDGRFQETASLLSDTHQRLRRHPVAESAPVLPGVLVNLGLAQTLCGRFSQAQDHLAEARSLSEERRLPLLGLVARHNLGCLALHRGDSASAIATFLELGPRLPADRREALHVDLAEALLSEGLVEQAAATLAEGTRGREGGSPSASALLVDAKLRLLNGDHQYAAELSRRVRYTFGPGSLWHRLAARLEHTARPGAVIAPRAPVPRAREALTLRTPLARTPAPSGTAAAPQALDALAARPGRPPGPWLGRAAHDPHVVRAGLETALAAGDAGTALEWAELAATWAQALTPGPRVPRTPVLSAMAGYYRSALADGRSPRTAYQALRWESARWHALYAAGSTPPVPTSGPPGCPSCTDDTSASEPTTPPVRSRTVVRCPTAQHAPVTGELAERLGERAFVRYTRAAGHAVALVVVAGRVHARDLGPLPQATGALARFAQQTRIGLPRDGRSLRRAAGRVGDLLLKPLLPLLGDGPLVVAGDPFLGDPAWGMLPALCGRPLNLVPTARFWLEHHGRASAPRRVLLVAGPEPTGARREVEALADLHTHTRVLTGARARPRAVLAGFGGADLVHLAGHGHVPEHSPMLASVGLHGGPLLACDLAELTSAPSVVTLSTCWNGRDFASSNGTPLGFVGALLSLGVRTVVASPVPVRDAETGAAMRRFHRALASGTAVPEAVSLHLGHTGFCCFGA